jgi:hypothetical protein
MEDEKNKQLNVRDYLIQQRQLEDILNQSIAEPYELSPVEKRAAGLASFLQQYAPESGLFSSFSDPRQARDLAENITFLSEFLPFYGDQLGFEEGRYLERTGSPILGRGIQLASTLPLVPFTPIKNIIKNSKLNIKTPKSPITEENTTTDITRDISDEYEFLIDRRIIKSFTEGKLDPNKPYNVKYIMDTVIKETPEKAVSPLLRQFNEMVDPEILNKKMTLTELMSHISTNKPIIKKQGDNPPTPVQKSKDTTQAGLSRYGYSEFMPDDTDKMLNYTEKNFAYFPRGEKSFVRPGHKEVGAGPEYEQMPIRSKEGLANEQNRIFTTRSGLYELDGKKVYITGEGQSGAYRMDERPKDVEYIFTANNKFAVQSEYFESTKLREIMDNFTSLDTIDSLSGKNVIEEMVPLLKPGKTKEDILKLNKQFEDASSMKSIQGATHSERILAQRDEYDRIEREILELFKKDPLDPKIKKAAENPPLLKDWFTTHMTESIQEAVKQGADVIRFPISASAVSPMMGMSPNSKKAMNLGETYRRKTEEGLKVIEAKYEIPIDSKRVSGPAYKRELFGTEPSGAAPSEYIEIEVTPELKEAFQVVILNTGGPVMKLKHGFN